MWSVVFPTCVPPATSSPRECLCNTNSRMSTAGWCPGWQRPAATRRRGLLLRLRAWTAPPRRSTARSPQDEVLEPGCCQRLPQVGEDPGSRRTDAADRHAQAGADLLVADRRRRDQQLHQLPVPIGELRERSTGQHLVLASQRGRLGAVL